MPTLEETAQRIIDLANGKRPEAIGLSVTEVDAYLASFRDPSGKARYRAELARKLLQDGPKTPLMEKIVEAINNGKTPIK